jgi:trimeric autotransporter adhesin
VKFHLNRFLRRVRIHGGEFDTSARAMYRVSEKGSLISYEKAFSTRADLRIVRGSTIERKQMSTKTTFKRIALVTVAALGFGTMAAVSPASATATATSVTIGNTTVYGYVGSESLTASINVTVNSSAALSTADSFTITANTATKPTNALAPESVTADSHTAQLSLAVNQFRLWESNTAGNYDEVARADSRTIQYVAKTTGETGTAIRLGTLAFVPSTPGTYTFTVTPSSPAGATTATYLAGTVTFIVLSAGAATGDGGVATPFNAAGGVAGAGNYNQVKVTGQKGTTALGTRVVVTGSTFDAAITGSTLSTDKTVLTIAGVTGSTAITQGLINVLTPTVGTITVTTFLESAIGTYSATASNTVTITVRAAALTGTATSSTTYMATGATAPTATTDAAVVALTSVPSKSSTADLATAVANVEVIQYDALEAEASSSKTLAVTAEITGAGRIGQAADASDATSIIAIPAGSAAAPQGPTDRFYVFADGRSGEATITIKVGGVTTLTRKVAFFGAATQLKLVAATATAPNPSKSFLAVGGTMTIAVLPYDANNVKLAVAAVTATSETATVATVVAGPTTGSVTVTGVAVGKTNITIKNGTLGTLVVPVEVTAKTGVAVLTLDKTSAQPGEKVTWTITATDSKGRPVADGTYAFFSSVTSNMSVIGLPTGTETITGGVATGSFFAPTSGSGTLQITATHGTAHDTYIAGLKAATTAGTTYTAVKDVVELVIVNAAVDAATAAAELAEAAAQDATDAALDATEAATLAGALAQEAVDAVADLSTQVATLIAALKKQITTLTNLVIKIQKKVRA